MKRKSAAQSGQVGKWREEYRRIPISLASSVNENWFEKSGVSRNLGFKDQGENEIGAVYLHYQYGARVVKNSSAVCQSHKRRKQAQTPVELK